MGRQEVPISSVGQSLVEYLCVFLCMVSATSPVIFVLHLDEPVNGLLLHTGTVAFHDL